MKKNFQLFLFAILYAADLSAQPSNAAKKPVEFSIVMKLQPGEKAIPFYSCMWLNEKNEFRRLTIEHPGNKYSVIAGGARKDDLSMEQMLQYTTSSNCDEHDPNKPPKATRYAGAKLVTKNAHGKNLIKSGSKQYGPFEEILFIQEKGEKFIAVAKALNNDKTEIIYIDAAGNKKLLPAQPVQYITNADLTKAAIILPPVEAIPLEIVNTWQQEKKIAYFDSLSKKQNLAWFSNDSMATIGRKYTRLEFDVSGRHFVSVYTDHFMIGGKRINKSIAAAGTRIFAGNDPANWAYWFEIYLAFSDGSSYKDVISPYLTVENDKSYLNWFTVESNKNGDIIKKGKKEL